MKLREYLKNLNMLAERSPEALDYPVYFASDSEGNDITANGFGASIQYTNKVSHNIDIQSEQDEEYNTPVIVLN